MRRVLSKEVLLYGKDLLIKCFHVHISFSVSTWLFCSTIQFYYCSSDLIELFDCNITYVPTLVFTVKIDVECLIDSNMSLPSDNDESGLSIISGSSHHDSWDEILVPSSLSQNKVKTSLLL